MHICIGKLTITGTDNGLLPDWHKAIIWTNDGILLIGPWEQTEILIEIHIFSFKKMHFKMSSGKWEPFCLSLLKVSWLHIFNINSVENSSSSHALIIHQNMQVTLSGWVRTMMFCTVHQESKTPEGLTHWGWDKMAAIFQMTFSDTFSWMKVFEFCLIFHCFFIPYGPIDYKSALVQIIAWRQAGDKPLSEPIKQ